MSPKPAVKVRVDHIKTKAVAAATESFAALVLAEIPEGHIKDLVVMRLNALANLADRAVYDPPVIKAPKNPR